MSWEALLSEKWNRCHSHSWMPFLLEVGRVPASLPWGQLPQDIMSFHKTHQLSEALEENQQQRGPRAVRWRGHLRFVFASRQLLKITCCADIECRQGVSRGGGEGEGRLESLGCKLLHIGWINKTLLYSRESYIQYPMINHNWKEY